MRGPDAAGEWADPETGIAMAHRRLAILDLTTAGHQPMLSHDKRFVTVFNGEIYNFGSLRSQLEALGCNFVGASDTEVMAEAFSAWGVEDTLPRLVGMFAFAAWDRKERTLWLAHDRMGEKPLYYGWNGSAFLFGSVLSALTAYPKWQGEVDRNSLALYLQLQYVPSPFSIYRGIRKLPAGCYLRILLTGLSPGTIPEAVSYWSLLAVAEDGIAKGFEGSESEAVNELEGLLRQAVKGQMIADVPLGAFLSGGVDSSTVVALMQKISPRPVKTFTIGFDEKLYNEAHHAGAIARHLGTDHTAIIVTAKDALDAIPLMPAIYDEPFADQSQIPTFLVAKMARRHVTVSLSGDGGDELFCGYNRHAVLRRLWPIIGIWPRSLRLAAAFMLDKLPAPAADAILGGLRLKARADQLQKLIGVVRSDSLVGAYSRLIRLWDNDDEIISDMPHSVFATNDRIWPNWPDPLSVLLFVEMSTSLPDNMMVKVDRAAMAVSLETRVPLLDHRIVEFCWRLPLRMKLRNGVSKWILRQVLYKHVPREMIDRPKSGFETPMGSWLRGPLREWAQDLLDPRSILQDGFLNPKPIQKRWREHLSGRKKWQHHLWAVLMFQAWLRRAGSTQTYLAGGNGSPENAGLMTKRLPSGPTGT